MKYNNFIVYDNVDKVKVCIKTSPFSNNDDMLVDLFYSKNAMQTDWVSITNEKQKDFKLISFDKFETLVNYDGPLKNTIYFNNKKYLG